MIHKTKKYTSITFLEMRGRVRISGKQDFNSIRKQVKIKHAQTRDAPNKLLSLGKS